MFVYYKFYIMIELTFLRELMFNKQMHQKSVMFVTIGIFEIIVLRFKNIYAIYVMIY